MGHFLLPTNCDPPKLQVFLTRHAPEARERIQRKIQWAQNICSVSVSNNNQLLIESWGVKCKLLSGILLASVFVHTLALTSSPSVLLSVDVRLCVRLLMFACCFVRVSCPSVCVRPGYRGRRTRPLKSVSGACPWGASPRTPVWAAARCSPAADGSWSSGCPWRRGWWSASRTSTLSCRTETCVSPGTGRADTRQTRNKHTHLKTRTPTLRVFVFSCLFSTLEKCDELYYSNIFIYSVSNDDVCSEGDQTVD